MRLCDSRRAEKAWKKLILAKERSGVFFSLVLATGNRSFFGNALYQNCVAHFLYISSKYFSSTTEYTFDFFLTYKTSENILK